MPLHEFRCSNNHITEKLFTNFSSAEGVDCIDCKSCAEVGYKIPSVPYAAHFHGNPDGYNRPSPAKRHTYKTVSQKDGNKHSIG